MQQEKELEQRVKITLPRSNPTDQTSNPRFSRDSWEDYSDYENTNGWFSKSMWKRYSDE